MIRHNILAAKRKADFPRSSPVSVYPTLHPFNLHTGWLRTIFASDAPELLHSLESTGGHFIPVISIFGCPKLRPIESINYCCITLPNIPWLKKSWIIRAHTSISWLSCSNHLCLAVIWQRVKNKCLSKWTNEWCLKCLWS